jgi:cytochrome c-type biogenesis protein CcsB
MQFIQWIKKLFLIIALILLGLSSVSYAKGSLDFSPLRTIPILDQGRVKPLDTFARESVQTITGKRSYLREDPLQTLLHWIAQPEAADNEPLILVQYEPLNKRVGIVAENRRISPKALLGNGSYKIYLKNIMIKQQEGEKLDSLEKEASALFQRLDLFYRITSGSALTIFPDSKTNTWLGMDTVTDSKAIEAFKTVLADFSNQDSQAFLFSTQSLKEYLRQIGQEVANYPQHENQIKREITYNKIRPFQKSWIAFFISFVAVLIALGIKKQFPYHLAILFALVGSGFNIYGFVIRCLIAGRAPVTNMYESVIWVSFGAMIFALIFEAIYRSKYFILAASAVSTLGLVLADNLPQILSPNINPLVPVLRSNYWLTVHVLTITLSYAAFLLAMGVGQVTIGYYAFKPFAREKIKSLNLFLYRTLQVGVVLLAAGTILGGVWANYSWGRFWGWDPKEVWALIALLGYVAILHGRFAGWLSEFGIAVWSVLAFLLVLMAWYGVNFVLGVGLHSYGFSSGGFRAVISFVVVQLAWVVFATVKYRRYSYEF